MKEMWGREDKSQWLNPFRSFSGGPRWLERWGEIAYSWPVLLSEYRSR